MHNGSGIEGVRVMSDIKTKPSTSKYRKNYDRIFRPTKAKKSNKAK
jgi:hypothetical protein